MKNFMIILFSILATSIMAQGHSLKCETPRGSKEFLIEKSTITYKTPFISGRSVASINSVRTKLVGSGIQKVWFHQGEKFTIHIDDINNFSQIDDYLNIKSSKGHTMTFPLTCKKS